MMDIERGVSEPEGEMPLRKAVGYVLLAVVPFLIVTMFYVGAYAKAWYERRGPAYNPMVLSQECHDIKAEVGFALDQTLEVLHRGGSATPAEKRAAADRLRAVMPDEESATSDGQARMDGTSGWTPPTSSITARGMW